MPWLLILTMLAGCVGQPVLVGDRGSTLRWHPRFHTVVKGDTLYSIAWTYGQDYRRVARWNGLSPPYLIRPGQRIRIAPPPNFADWRSSSKGGELSVTTAGREEAAGDTPVASAKAYPRQGAGRRPAVTPLPEPPAASPAAVGKVEWQWPVAQRPDKGVRFFRSRHGIDIEGRRGQPVYAAASGRVVYAGSGLVGYGRLIILKHNEQYLSAYAHNRELLVKEGEQVAKGVQIASMGSSGADRVMLHFEIRRNGKPVDPLRYLPVR